MKNAFEGLISKLDTAEERLSLLETLSRNLQNITSRGTKNYIWLLRNRASKTREEWNFIVLRENNYHPRILYPVKSSFKSEGEIKIFSNNNWGIALPVGLPCKNNTVFREKECDIGQKLESTSREEHWRRNKWR